LVERLQADFLDLEPDIVTILVGVNDSWHRYDPTYIDTTDQMTESNYRLVLDALKERNIPVVMIEPFALPTPRTQEFRFDLYGKIEIIRKLAREYACAYIPLDGLAVADSVANGTLHLADDGIHPNEAGRKWLGKLVADALKPIVEQILCNG
jgi:lysophospholipase L1-like esterase